MKHKIKHITNTEGCQWLLNRMDTQKVTLKECLTILKLLGCKLIFAGIDIK